MDNIHNLKKKVKVIETKQKINNNEFNEEIILKIYLLSNFNDKKTILMLNLKIFFFIINSKEFKLNIIKNFLKNWNFNKLIK